MRLALLHGQSTFIGIKMLVTGFGVIFLSIHQCFTMARLAMRMVFVLYLVLTAYHLLLLSMH